MESTRLDWTGSKPCTIILFGTESSENEFSARERLWDNVALSGTPWVARAHPIHIELPLVVAEGKHIFLSGPPALGVLDHSIPLFNPILIQIL